MNFKTYTDGVIERYEEQFIGIDQDTFYAVKSFILSSLNKCREAVLSDVGEWAEKNGFTRNSEYYIAVQRKLKQNILAHDVPPEVSSQILLEAEDYLHHSFKSHLTKLKEELK